MVRSEVVVIQNSGAFVAKPKGDDQGKIFGFGPKLPKLSGLRITIVFRD